MATQRFEWGGVEDPGTLAGIRQPEPVKAPAWAFGVLIFGALLILAICH